MVIKLLTCEQKPTESAAVFSFSKNQGVLFRIMRIKTNVFLQRVSIRSLCNALCSVKFNNCWVMKKQPVLKRKGRLTMIDSCKPKQAANPKKNNSVSVTTCQKGNTSISWVLLFSHFPPFNVLSRLPMYKWPESQGSVYRSTLLSTLM